MEVQVLSKEEIVCRLSLYEEREKTLQVRRKKILTFCSVLIFLVYLYFRLFHTAYEIVWTRGDEADIRVKYSTAWVVRIPSEYQGKRITAVSNGTVKAFDIVCPYVKFVYIDDGVETINDEAGFCRSEIVAVRLPGSLKYIGDRAFDLCTSLKKVYLDGKPEGLVIGEEAFCCTGLKNVAIPEGVIEIGEGAFGNNYKLKSVTMSDSVLEIKARAFQKCTKLKSVTLSNKIDTLPCAVFSGCSSLTELKHAENIRCVFLGALYNTLITEEKLPSNLYFNSRGQEFRSSLEQREVGFTVSRVNYLNSGEVSEKTWDYDMASENVYFAEKTGIPIEVFEQPTDYEKVWIEGKEYQFPISLEEFMGKDSWTEVTDYDETIQLQHNETGKRITLYKWTLGANVKILGFEVAENDSCAVVLPGGVTNQGMLFCRPYELFPCKVKLYETLWFFLDYSIPMGSETAQVSVRADGAGGQITEIQLRVD